MSEHQPSDTSKQGESMSEHQPSDTSKISRRQAMKMAGVAAAVMPLATLLTGRAAWAQEKLSMDDPMAKALQYHDDASKVDPSIRGGTDRFCHNCIQYTGDPKGATGPCNIFPGKLVSSKGWCMSWVKKG